jgi:hypothetical protein
MTDRFREQIKQVVIGNLQGIAEAYLVTVPDDDGQAQRELFRFLEWVKGRLDEPDTPGPEVH